MKRTSRRLQTDTEYVSLILAWEVEAALGKIKNGKKREKITSTLKAGNETIAKELATVFTKCITERGILKTWKEGDMLIFFSRKTTENFKRHQ